MAERTRRERLLTFLILPATVVGVLVLGGVSFRNSLQLEDLRERSVVEATLSLAKEKADRLDKLIVKQDNVVAVEADVSQPAQLDSKWLDVAARETPTVRAVLILDLSASDRDVIAFASRAPGPDDERFRRLLVHQLLDDMVLDEAPREQLRHLHGTYEGVSYLLSYWQRVHRGRWYLVVAWHDVPRIVRDFLPALGEDPDGQTRVNVVDANGLIIFGPPLSGGEFTVGRHFDTTLYKWRLNVSMTSAEELARGVEQRRMLEMVLVALSAVVVVAGMFVVLVAAYRERKLSNLKSDFVANVSHELKTPLALVRMFGELLQSGRVESDEKRQEYLGIIVGESERLTALIENVLDFARAERGKSTYEFVESDLGIVVSRAVEACRVRAEREDVTLELHVPAGLPAVRVDERAIEVAVINLVDNAVKYARDGKVVRVSVEERGGGLEVRVSDRGPGIPAEDRKRIFDRFERGRGATGEQIRGSGIGLALVRHIAEAHGGQVAVEPGKPHGATFVFSIRAHSRGTERRGDRRRLERASNPG